MIRLAYENPELRSRLLPILASVNEAVEKSKAVNKLMKSLTPKLSNILGNYGMVKSALDDAWQDGYDLGREAGFDAGQLSMSPDPYEDAPRG